ncbi:MAG: hypothetical protein BM564_12480 [Bacteroidetes bacterium MedPE-SWsnd-G2]|nr:MAG: hypothetical protein BM564_12480 [Bacteroidetes bacterium MedPE-SWsnd-G2]
MEKAPKHVSVQQWLKHLLNAIVNHGLELVFVIFVIVIFRAPHLSDLTVVIIQLKDNLDFVVMPVFYASILVLALFIGYGNLIKFKKLDANEEIKIEGSKKSLKLRWRSLNERLKRSINLKDSKERELEYSTLSQEAANKENAEDYVSRIYPKALAVISILGIAFTVENTYEVLFGTLITVPYFFLSLAVILIGLTHPSVNSFFETKLKWKTSSNPLAVIIVVGAIATILILGVFNDGGTKSDIRNLFWSLFCLSLVFFVLSFSYNKLILWFKAKIGMPVAFALSVICLILYASILINPELHTLKNLTPTVILMICVLGLYFVFLILKLIGRYYDWPLLVIVVFAAIISTVLVAKSNSFKHYEVSTVSSENIDVDDRMSLEDYVDKFIRERRDSILNPNREKPFPIILVSAEGGGSRAGLWSFLVHSYLYEKSELYFKQHLFSLTGASGGGVGNNLFFAQAAEHHSKYDSTLFLDKKHNAGLCYKASGFYQNDYISSSIAGLLGRDLIASIFHLKFNKDRAKITETEWEASFNASFGNDILKRPYLKNMPNKSEAYTLPLMVTTTTNVQTGKLFVMSPVKFNQDGSNGSGFGDLLLDYAKHNPKSNMFKRSSAMLLTARFPYLSPSGRVSGVGQFGDGGYYDNVGGVVSRYLESVLVKKLKVGGIPDSCYEIRHLIIVNTPPKKKLSYYSEFLAPPQMAVSAIFAHADEFVASKSDKYKIVSKRTDIEISNERLFSFIKSKPKRNELFKPLIPLSRYLSLDAVKSMERRLENDSVRCKLDSLML